MVKLPNKLINFTLLDPKMKQACKGLRKKFACSVTFAKKG